MHAYYSYIRGKAKRRKTQKLQTRSTHDVKLLKGLEDYGTLLYHKAAFFMVSVCVCICMCVLQLQKSKEREEQLEDVIQAYEKIHMEKTSLQRDLDKMVRVLLNHLMLHTLP